MVAAGCTHQLHISSLVCLGSEPEAAWGPCLLGRAVLYCAVSGWALLCCAVLCCAVLCCAELCCAVLC